MRRGGRVDGRGRNAGAKERSTEAREGDAPDLLMLDVIASILQWRIVDDGFRLQTVSGRLEVSWVVDCVQSFVSSFLPHGDVPSQVKLLLNASSISRRSTEASLQISQPCARLFFFTIHDHCTMLPAQTTISMLSTVLTCVSRIRSFRL